MRKLRAVLLFVLLIFFSACTAGELDVSTDTNEKSGAVAPLLKEVAESQSKEPSAIAKIPARVKRLVYIYTCFNLPAKLNFGY